MPEQNGHAMGRVRHIHLVGVGGAGMSGIAEVLHNLGYQVSGSDLRESAITRHLQEMGIRVLTGHDACHVNGSDVIVVSSAVPDDNAEVRAARSQRIPVVPRAEMLAEIMRFRHGIAVAGTHGKTTTTSLVTSLLAEGGLDPTYVIGGRLNSSGTHARLGGSRYLVAEADESDASFLHLQPVTAVVTNIDSDHLGTYGGSYESLSEIFLEFLHHLPFYGLAVLCMDDPGVRALLPRVNKPVLTYGIDHASDFMARNIRVAGRQMEFTVDRHGERDWLTARLNLPGRHNVLNALAAIAVADELGVTSNRIRAGLESFQGIGRRCEFLGDLVIGGQRALLVDDYAHHPTEIAATLAAVRAACPGRRLLTIFQPHRFTRTRDLFEDFVGVLASADALILLEIYAAGEAPIAGADGRSLCRAIRLRGHVEPVFATGRGEIPALLPGMVEDGDVIVVLGAGDIGALAPELLGRFAA